MPEFARLAFAERAPAEMSQRAERFYELMRCRRSVRDFDHRPIPMDVVEHALLTAGSAPSGAPTASHGTSWW